MEQTRDQQPGAASSADNDDRSCTRGGWFSHPPNVRPELRSVNGGSAAGGASLDYDALSAIVSADQVQAGITHGHDHHGRKQEAWNDDGDRVAEHGEVRDDRAKHRRAHQTGANLTRVWKDVQQTPADLYYAGSDAEPLAKTNRRKDLDPHRAGRAVEFAPSGKDEEDADCGAKNPTSDVRLAFGVPRYRHGSPKW